MFLRPRRIVREICKQRLFGETLYAAASWDRERRVIMKAERLPAGPNTRFVVTNLAGAPQHLYDGQYIQRGEMENRIKEQQLMLFADRTSCHDFLANQFRLLLSSFAYLLLETLRRDHLAAPDSRSAFISGGSCLDESDSSEPIRSNVRHTTKNIANDEHLIRWPPL